jgi:hypothetical protein
VPESVVARLGPEREALLGEFALREALAPRSRLEAFGPL